MRHKFIRFEILRVAIQLLFFFLLPGLISECFFGLQAISEAIINGTVVDMAIFLRQIFPTVLIILSALVFGRYFCGWMCAFGTLGDLFNIFGSKVLHIRVKVGERLDKALKALKYVVLAVIVVFVWIGGVSWFDTWSPWDAFGMLNTFPPDVVYTFSLFGVGTVLLIFFMVGSLFVERFFCRYFCPLGALLCIVSLLRVGKIKKQREVCEKCRACSAKCAMGIPLYRYDIVKSGECTDCLKCIAICPKKNARFTIASRDSSPLVVILAVFLTMAVYFIGNIGLDSMASMPTKEAIVVQQPTAAPSAQQAAAPTEQIAEKVEPTAKPTSTPTPAPTPTPEAQNVNGLTDGVYEGSGTGYKRRTTTVSVVIEGGQITDIITIDTGDDRPYYSRAFSSVYSQILDSQTAEVDAVSGATFSSKGIMDAVADALSKVKS